MSSASLFSFRPPSRQRLARLHARTIAGMSETAARAFLDDATERARTDELARLARIEIDPATVRPLAHVPKEWSADVRSHYAEACLRTALALDRSDRALTVAEIDRETVVAVPIAGPTCHQRHCQSEIEPWVAIALNEYNPRREMILLVSRRGVSRGASDETAQMLFRLPFTVPTATLAKVSSARAA